MNSPSSLLFILLLGAGILTTGDALSQDAPTRYPLLELFTNTPCPICANQDPGFKSRLEGYEGKYHLVSFYPGTPYTSCIFYQYNTTENRARRDFYPQVVGTPDVAINGVDFRSPNGVSTIILDDITGQTSWLSVSVSETSGVTRDVAITLENHGGGDLDTGILFAVIVEREIMYDAPNGIKLHENVFRRFLTDVEGDAVDMSSDIITLEYDYMVDIEWQLEEAYVVAWLMNPDTKEVINSGTKYDEVVASTKLASEVIPLEIFPNPSSDYINIRVPQKSDGGLRIYDTTGKLVHQEASLESTLTRVPVSTWANGTYIVELILEDGISRGVFEVVR